MAELILKEEVFRVVGAAMEVYNELGHGFLEAVYQEALEMELANRGIPHKPQRELRIMYKGRQLKKFYICDMCCFDCLLVEIKVAGQLTSIDESQLLNYLNATGLRVGVLLNFGNPKGLEWKRMVL